MTPQANYFHWFPRMMLLQIILTLGAALLDARLRDEGMPDLSGSVMIAMVCAVTALRAPQPVMSHLQWRVGFWGARIIAAVGLGADVVTTPLLPEGGQVLVGVGAMIGASFWVMVLVDRWKLRWSALEQQPKEESQQ